MELMSFDDKFKIALNYYRYTGNETIDLPIINQYKEQLLYCYENDLSLKQFYSWISVMEESGMEISYADSQLFFRKPAVYWNTIASKFSDMKDEEIQKHISFFCKKHHLHYNFSEGMLCIQTQAGGWRVILDDEYNVTKLYHEDFCGNRLLKKNHFECGFHLQNKNFNSIFDCLNYIEKHDRNFMKAKVPGNKIYKGFGVTIEHNS